MNIPQSGEGEAARMPEASSGAPVAQIHGSHEPRSVIRGETNQEPTKHTVSIAHIDWLSFGVRPPTNCSPLLWIAEGLEFLFGITREDWRPSPRGWQGYKSRFDLADFGLLAYGGKNQRGTIHVSLNAKACAQVELWDRVQNWGAGSGAWICRCDLAYDDFEGVSVSVDLGLKWLAEGGFSGKGRPAKAHLRDDLGSGEGRTLYIGNRGNGKLTRIYEKGKQLGDPTSPWVRAETELRNKNRVIPWDVLVKPGTYLAGAYPCFRHLHVDQDRIRTTRRIHEMSYDAMMDWLKSAAGRALRVAVEVEGGDAVEVLQKVMRPGIPKRLRGIPQIKEGT